MYICYVVKRILFYLTIYFIFIFNVVLFSMSGRYIVSRMNILVIHSITILKTSQVFIHIPIYLCVCIGLVKKIFILKHCNIKEFSHIYLQPT